MSQFLNRLKQRFFSIHYFRKEGLTMAENRCSKRANLTGMKFGRLTVISLDSQNKRNDRIWECRCDCGNTTCVKTYNLTHGKTKSCGCLVKDHEWSIKHNCHDKRIYKEWQRMKSRCLYAKNEKVYKHYGGRGISICNEWLSENGFPNFMKWALSNGYKDNLTLDRINNDGNYSPDNCRWVDSMTQANNTRQNKIISYNGESHTVAEWSRIRNIKYPTLVCRINRGWDIERALEYGK